MKNYLLPVLFLVVFPCILLSCKKKEQISFPQTLYASNIVNTSGIRMFTNGSENKDTTMIKKYIGNSEYFNLTTVDTSLRYKYRKIPVPAGTNLMNYITKEVRAGHGNYQELTLSGY